MLTVSVIGCGHGGTLSIEAVSGSGEYALIAAADPSADVLEQVAVRVRGVRLFPDYRDMLRECHTDVVCVATPAPGHAPIAREVLGCHPKGMLIEKPLACAVSTAEQLLRELSDAACPVVVPHGMLVLPAAQEVKARIRRGDIGKIVSVNIQNAVDLLNGGIHWLAYLVDVFFDDKPASVTADFDVSGHAVSDGVQVESRGVTQIEFESGLNITLHSGIKTKPTSEVLPPEQQRGALFRVAGSKGLIEFSAWAGSYFLQVGASEGELVMRPLPGGLSYHQVFLEQLAQTITLGKQGSGSAELSLAALRLIESAYQQQGSSKWALGVPARQY